MLRVVAKAVIAAIAAIVAPAYVIAGAVNFKIARAAKLTHELVAQERS